MNNPETYHIYNSFQKRDADLILKKFTPKLKFKKDVNIIDLGSGDGLVTQTILKKYIPEFKEVVGVDIGEKMVEFANNTYGDERTKFRVMDLRDEAPADLKGKFDLAFSSYVIQFISHTDQPFQNAYDFLVDGGSCILLFMGHMRAYDVFIALSKREKWRDFLKNIDSFVPKYHHMKEKDMEDDLKKTLHQIGFKNIDVQVSESVYYYEDADLLKKLFGTANCFNMPDKENEEFMDDYMQLAFEMKALEKVNDNSKAANFIYSKIEVFATK